MRTRTKANAYIWNAAQQAVPESANVATKAHALEGVPYERNALRAVYGNGAHGYVNRIITTTIPGPTQHAVAPQKSPHPSPHLHVRGVAHERERERALARARPDTL